MAQSDGENRGFDGPRTNDSPEAASASSQTSPLPLAAEGAPLDEPRRQAFKSLGALPTISDLSALAREVLFEAAR